MEIALRRGMRAVLGSATERIEASMDRSRQESWPPLPAAEADILWIRNNLPDRSSEILAQAKQFLHSTPGELV